MDGTSPLDDEVCGMLAGQAGLDQDAFHRSLAHRNTAAQLASTVAHAAARGAFGVPSFVLGDQAYFGNDRLVLLRHALLTAAAPPG